VAFVGEGTSAGPRTIFFSSPGAGGSGWTQRTLKSAPIGAGATITEVDDTPSFYEIMGAGRKLNDDPTTED
jgi:hypothetical protein